MERLNPLCWNRLGLTARTTKKVTSYQIDRIIDGDTFKVSSGRESLTVRIACIDAPEMSEKPFGQISKDELTGLLKQNSFVDLKTKGKDRFGRIVAEVFRRDGLNVGLEMVKGGYATVVDKFADQCTSKLDKEEFNADLKGRGLWGIWGDFGFDRRAGDGLSYNTNLPVIAATPASGTATPPMMTSDTRTCSDFSTYSAALGSYLAGNLKLDGDRDGIPCESLR